MSIAFIVQPDRRHSDLFPIEREVRYRVLNKRGGDESGDGKTINISSAGILFTTESMVLPGRRLEVSINWPAQLNNKCALKLRLVDVLFGLRMGVPRWKFSSTSSAHPAPATRPRKLPQHNRFF